MQIAETQVDDPVGVRAHHAFDLKAIDVGADIVVDRGAGHDLAELKILVFIVKGGRIQLQRTVAEAVLRPDFKGIDLFGLEGFGYGEDRLQRRVDAARFVAARVRGIDEIVVGDLVVDHEAPRHLFITYAAALEGFATRHRADGADGRGRSEEHTSELQSLMRISYAVFCLKKTQITNKQQTNHIEKEDTQQ